jgi:hypothetical protein
MIGRSRDCATPAERGHDGRPDSLDAAEVPPVERRHELETVDDHDGPPVERCRHCERVGRLGAIDPFGACPDRRDGGLESDAVAELETVSTP